MEVISSTEIEPGIDGRRSTTRPGSGSSQGEETTNGAALTRRNTLLEIENSPALRLRLGLWQREDEMLRQRIEQKEQSLNKTQNEIYQLFGIFAVFQGVVLTALAQASKLKCAQWWIPFVLTIFAGATVTFAVWYKLQQCEKIQSEVQLEKANSRAVQAAIQGLLGLGVEYDERNMEHQPSLIVPLQKKLLKWKVSIILSIVAFTTLMATVCKFILCS